MPRVVLFPVDVSGSPVLPAIERLAVGPGQVSVIRPAHSVLFPVDALLLTFEPGGFSRSELAAANALGDAVLLIFLSLQDRSRLSFRCGAVAGLRESARRAQCE